MGTSKRQQGPAATPRPAAAPAAAPVDFGSNAAQIEAIRQQSAKARCEENYGGGIDWEGGPWLEGEGAEIHVGGWCTDEGDRAYGIDGGVHAGELDLRLPGSRVDVSGANANGQIGWMGDHLAVGGQANLVEGSIRSEDDFDPASATDDAYRFGLSLGVGGAGRFHAGDADRDGRREWGFGFDAGPVAMDYKTETPVRDAALAALLGPVHFLNYAFLDNMVWEPISRWYSGEDPLTPQLDLPPSEERVGPW